MLKKDEVLDGLNKLEAALAAGEQTWVGVTAIQKIITLINSQSAEIESLKLTQCAGIPRRGCNYLEHANHLCTRCGEMHTTSELLQMKAEIERLQSKLTGAEVAIRELKKANEKAEALRQKVAELEKCAGFNADGMAREMSLQSKVAGLESLLREAVQDISDWGSYASEYFQDKHDLAGTIKKYESALPATPQPDVPAYENKIAELTDKVAELEKQKDSRSVVLSGHALREAADLANPDEGDQDQLEGEVEIMYLDGGVTMDDGSIREAGYYLLFVECPEEGVTGPLGKPHPTTPQETK